MIRHSTLFSLLTIAMLVGWHSTPTPRLTLTEASTLWVTGTSTVHDWQCDASRIEGWVEAESDELLNGITGAEITMQADALECKNRTMNRKTRNALEADDHPVIRYELTTAEVVPDTASPDTAKAFLVNTTGQLTIAGQTRTVTTTLQGLLTGNGQLRFSGELPVTMSDYGIKPPTAMLGVLKTGDDVTVHLEMVATPTSE